jgi:hypothetical protein
MITNVTRDSIDFSFDNDQDLKELLDNISSSHSANVSCLFEQCDDIEVIDGTKDEIIKSRANRKLIPEDIK